MEKTMRKSRRYSGAFDCGIRISDFGLKEIREVQRTRASAFDCGIRISDFGLKEIREVQRTLASAFDCGFRNSDFQFQSIDKKGWCKWPVAECFAKHLLIRAEALNSQNVSKPRARIADYFSTSVTLSEVEVRYQYFCFGIQDATRREGEMETWESSRNSSSSLNVVALNGGGRAMVVERSRNQSRPVEVRYSEVMGSSNDPTSMGQIAETGRNANHFQVSGSDRRSISTLSFELFTLSLSSFRMHGKINSTEGIPINRVFTN